MDHRNPLPEDPSGLEGPHDVLAAEEFGIGTRDERLPRDPSGIQEPHDVLAAEEFAMPAGADRTAGLAGGSDPRTWVPLTALAAVVLFLLWRASRRSA